jgi:uncharacterized membrane protein
MAEPELVAFCSLAQPHRHQDPEAGLQTQEVDLLVAVRVEASSSSEVHSPHLEDEAISSPHPPSEDEEEELPAARLLDDGGGGRDGGEGECSESLGPAALMTDGDRRPVPRAARISSSVVSFISVTTTRVVTRGGQLHAAGRDCCRRSLGLLVALLSGILMVAYSSLIKILVEMDSMQVVIIRGLLQMLIFGTIALFKRLSFRGEASLYTLAMLTVVSVTGGLRMMFIFISFARLPLGDSTAIIFSSPVFVMVLSICVLKAGQLSPPSAWLVHIQRWKSILRCLKSQIFLSNRFPGYFYPEVELI